MTKHNTLIIKRGKIIFYIREESITVKISNLPQYILYSTYMMQNRRSFFAFRKKVLRSVDGELDTPSKVLTLANELSLIAVGTNKPLEEED